MVYSVYDHRTKRYDYYEDGRNGGTHAGAPSVVASGKIGVVPEAATWRLPVAASKIGSGEMPRGRIASRGALPMAGIDAIVPTGAALVLGVGVLAYLAWRKR